MPHDTPPDKAQLTLISPGQSTRELELPSSYSIADLKEIIAFGESFRDCPQENISFSIKFSGKVLADTVRFTSFDLSSKVVLELVAEVGSTAHNFDLGNVARKLVQLASGEVTLAKHRHQVSESQRRASAAVMRACSEFEDGKPFSPAVESVMEDELDESITSSSEYQRVSLSVEKILCALRSPKPCTLAFCESLSKQFADDTMALCAMVHNEGGEERVQSFETLSSLISAPDSTAAHIASRILYQMFSSNVKEYHDAEALVQRIALGLSTGCVEDISAGIQSLVTHYCSLFIDQTNSGLLPMPTSKSVPSPEMLRWTQCLKRVSQ